MFKPYDERLRLPVEHSVLLWCMRAWVAGQRHPIQAAQCIEDMLARLDAPGAAPYLEGFMFVLRHAATRPLAVACMCYPRVTGDERALLAVFRLVQEARPFEALLLLRGPLTPEGARAALRSAEGVGLALARAGRDLAAPDAGLSRLALEVEVADAARRAGSTLH